MSVTKNEEGKVMITGGLYDFLKNAVLIYLPAVSAAYFSLGGIWGFPNVEQVVGTIAVITIFLGTCLKISNNNYNQAIETPVGALVITQTDDGKLYSLEIDKSPQEIRGLKSVTFEVKDQSAP